MQIGEGDSNKNIHKKKATGDVKDTRNRTSKVKLVVDKNGSQHKNITNNQIRKLNRASLWRQKQKNKNKIKFID